MDYPFNYEVLISDGVSPDFSQPIPDNDPHLRHLGGWRYRLAQALHYPCYFVLVGAQVVQGWWDEWRGE